VDGGVGRDRFDVEDLHDVGEPPERGRRRGGQGTTCNHANPCRLYSRRIGTSAAPWRNNSARIICTTRLRNRTN
jgi:hypothetical protein